MRKPQDKAKVEQGVLLAERSILAALRHRTGTYPHLLLRLAKAQALILDDLGLEPLGSCRLRRNTR